MKKWKWLSVIAAVSLFFAGCGNDTETPATTDTTTTETEAQTTEGDESPTSETPTTTDTQTTESGESPKTEIIAGSTARESLTIDGVALEKTGEIYATGSESVTITGATPSFVDSNAADYYKGVFIEGRTVTLSPFIMGKYQVTQELYKAVMTDQKVNVNGTEHTLAAEPSYCTESSTTYALADAGTQKLRPVEGVTWYDAVYFCNALSTKLSLTPAYTIDITTVDTNGHITAATVTSVENANGYRLPTEAEWEFAARGGDPSAEAWNYLFSGADTGKISTAENADAATYDSAKNTGLDSVGWYCYNNKEGTTGETDVTNSADGKGTHEVGKKTANALGIYDMSGNVWEWCYDLYNSTVSTGSETDPAGASSGSGRVKRGGSWLYYANGASVCYRSHVQPVQQALPLGLPRCSLRSVTPLAKEPSARHGEQAVAATGQGRRKHTDKIARYGRKNITKQKRIRQGCRSSCSLVQIPRKRDFFCGAGKSIDNHRICGIFKDERNTATVWLSPLSCYKKPTRFGSRGRLYFLPYKINLKRVSAFSGIFL